METKNSFSKFDYEYFSAESYNHSLWLENTDNIPEFNGFLLVILKLTNIRNN